MWRRGATASPGMGGDSGPFPGMVRRAAGAHWDLPGEQPAAPLGRTTEPVTVAESVATPNLHSIAKASTSTDMSVAKGKRSACMSRLSWPQIILALLALTSFHVQIINRISSGSPIWYLVIGASIMGHNWIRENKSSERTKPAIYTAIVWLQRIFMIRSVQQWLFRGMIMYAIIQGGLYASFLPPA